MPLPLETERLLLRPLASGDYGFIRSIHTDPEVMRYIAAGKTRTEEQSRAMVARSLAMAKEDPSLGCWVAELRESGLAVGNLILRKPATAEQTEGLEIGFSFLREHWGKGYATEASRRILEYVREKFGSIRVVALIDPANATSRKTLTKLGFKTVGRSQYVDPSTGNALPTELLEFQENGGAS